MAEIQKDLFYTKQEYSNILTKTKSMIKEIRKFTVKNDSKEYKLMLAELYGISFNAFAGLIRAGTLHEKRTGLNGFPDYIINIGGREYECSEFVLKKILGDEFVLLVHPYEDNYNSYVKTLSNENEFIPIQIDETNEKAKKKESKESLFNPDGLVNIIEKGAEAIKNIESPRPVEEIEYNPEYDHHYDDELKKLEAEADKIPKENFIRILCTMIAVAGLLISYIYII